MARARQGWDLRVAGYSWDEIAEQLGFANKSNAYRSVHSYLGTVPQFDAERERELWRQRLEWLWRKARRDVDEQRPGALTGGVRIAQAAARLSGLDAPEQVVIHNPTVAEINALVQRLTVPQPRVIEANVLGLPELENHPIGKGETL